MTTIARRAACLTLAGLLAACSDGAGPSTKTQVTFNLATGGPAGPALLMGDTLATDTDTLVLDSVQLVLRDIKFERVNEDACDDEHDDDGDDDRPDDDLTAAALIRPASLHDDDGEDDGDDGDSDACESFNAGPFLLDLPLGPDVERAFSVAVDTGTYEEVQFKIHKPRRDEGDPRDIAFLDAHPNFEGVSIRVVGAFNGEPFVFTTDLDAKQELEFASPLVVAGSMQNVDVTIKVDLSRWFADHQGGLVDPATANPGGEHASLVKDNIKDSFHAFRDDDCDGEDDDYEDEGSDD